MTTEISIFTVCIAFNQQDTKSNLNTNFNPSKRHAIVRKAFY